VDRQRSTVPWLKLRSEQSAVRGEPLHGWVADPRNVLRPPAGVRHVVLDTPGGLQGFDLGRVLTYADIVLVPLCDSLFDRESAATCLAELRAHPRVASGRVQVGVVGMRLDWAAEHRLREWAGEHDVKAVAALSASRIYVSAAERGLTVFDLPREAVERELHEWEPLLEWLTLAAQAVPPAATVRTRAPVNAAAGATVIAPASATARAVAGAGVSAAVGAVVSAAVSTAVSAQASAAVSAEPGARALPGAGAVAERRMHEEAASARLAEAAAMGIRVPISLIHDEPARLGPAAFVRRWFGWALPQAAQARGSGARRGSP
jgi:chromosome partitioning protein